MDENMLVLFDLEYLLFIKFKIIFCIDYYITILFGC